MDDSYDASFEEEEILTENLPKNIPSSAMFRCITPTPDHLAAKIASSDRNVPNKAPIREKEVSTESIAAAVAAIVAAVESRNSAENKQRVDRKNEVYRESPRETTKCTCNMWPESGISPMEYGTDDW